MKSYTYIIGIDEVGRGPIAGPVTVGAVLLPRKYTWKHFRGLKDSKKLSLRQREVWFSRVRNTPDILFSVSSISEKVIDTRGIVYAIKKALARSLGKLNVTSLECRVLLDGGLRAPKIYRNQRTIIKGDEKECVIALASIMAKVTRDKKMISLSKKYPEYGFERHKGYGTKEHYRKIRKHGLSDIHRKSFIHN